MCWPSLGKNSEGWQTFCQKTSFQADIFWTIGARMIATAKCGSGLRLLFKSLFPTHNCALHTGAIHYVQNIKYKSICKLKKEKQIWHKCVTNISESIQIFAAWIDLMLPCCANVRIISIKCQNRNFLCLLMVAWKKFSLGLISKLQFLFCYISPLAQNWPQKSYSIT